VVELAAYLWLVTVWSTGG